MNVDSKDRGERPPGEVMASDGEVKFPLRARH